MFKSLAKIEGLERRLDKLLGAQEQAPTEPADGVPALLDFVPRLSPTFERPEHLAKVAALFERAYQGEAIKAVISLPPRHSKTELMLHAIAWFLLKDPARQIAYASATASLSRKKSDRARTLAKRAGVSIAQTSHSKSDWRTTTDTGGLWATGVGGQINGEGFDLLLIDDAHKGRAEAESPVIRDRIYDWLLGDALPRLEPNASIFVTHTRWHNDDLIGRLLQRSDWESVCLPAISPEGHALWPSRWPLAKLLQRQDELGGPDGYDWCSLYQGQPKPDGTALFQDSHTYKNKPPLSACRIVIGVDFGYSKRGDYSTAVVLAELDGVFYVLDVLRAHLEPREFRARLQTLSQSYNSAPITAYVAATEVGNVEFLREAGLNVTTKRALVDKLSNAVHVSAAWNTEKVLCPESAPWLDAFVSEVCGFTGRGDRHDDQVDALAAAHDSLRLHAVDWEYLDRLASAWPAPLAF